MKKEPYKKYSKKQATADAKNILMHLPSEDWRQFFKKKVPNLAEHINANHSRILENPSKYALSVTQKELSAHFVAMNKRPALYQPFMMTDDPDNKIFVNLASSTANVVKDFKAKQKEKLSLGFVTISKFVDNIPALNKKIGEYGYEFCIFNYQIGQESVLFWVERKGTDYNISLSGRKISKVKSQT